MQDLLSVSANHSSKLSYELLISTGRLRGRRLISRKPGSSPHSKTSQRSTTTMYSNYEHVFTHITSLLAMLSTTTLARFHLSNPPIPTIPLHSSIVTELISLMHTRHTLHSSGISHQNALMSCHGRVRFSTTWLLRLTPLM